MRSHPTSTSSKAPVRGIEARLGIPTASNFKRLHRDRYGGKAIEIDARRHTWPNCLAEWASLESRWADFENEWTECAARNTGARTRGPRV